MSSRLKVIVEVVMSAGAGDEVLRFRLSKREHPRTGDPIATARAQVAAHFPELWLQKAIVQSTSWRYSDDSIVLTFLAYSDDMLVEGLPLSLPLASIEDLANDDAGPSSIAAHAIRHLAFLIATEPGEFVPKIREPALSKLRRIAPDVSRYRGSEAA